MTSLPAAFAENPLFFVIFFAIALPFIWLKWRVIGKSQQTTIANQTHGLRAAADRKQVRHETGIGTSEVLVMRRAKLGAAIWFALFFFGGGAVFYALVVLPAPEDPLKDWGVFAVMMTFTILGVFVMISNQTRIYVDNKGLEKRRLIRASQALAFADIVDVQPASKTLARGLMLHAKDGNTMKITADFSGYLDLLDRLTAIDPKLGLLVRMIRTRTAKTV